jgi:hypothetical protein
MASNWIRGFSLLDRKRQWSIGIGYATPTVSWKVWVKDNKILISIVGVAVRIRTTYYSIKVWRYQNITLATIYIYICARITTPVPKRSSPPRKSFLAWILFLCFWRRFGSRRLTTSKHILQQAQSLPIFLKCILIFQFWHHWCCEAM